VTHTELYGEPTTALYVLYYCAIYSNLGPMFSYSFLTWGILGGTSLGNWGTWCARAFLMLCATTHGVMMLMLIAMPLAMFHTQFWINLLIAHVVLNILQGVCAVVVTGAISRLRMRSIEFAPMGEEPPPGSIHDVRRRQQATDVVQDERAKGLSRRAGGLDRWGERLDKKAQDQHERDREGGAE
jgi:hypothetical protein